MSSPNNPAYRPKPFEVAGLYLVGYRQPDGSVLLGGPPDGTPLPDFPQEIRVEGAVYSLECIEKNRLELRIDNPEHPSCHIEWGVYV